jgi:hypothetical protein
LQKRELSSDCSREENCAHVVAKERIKLRRRQKRELNSGYSRGEIGAQGT